MIIIDETKLRDETLQMIGEDYGIIISESLINYPKWYKTQIDTIINKFKFDIDEFKEKLANEIINGMKIELKIN